jgi:hypothetical protein
MLLTLSCLTLDGGEAKCRGEIEAIEVQKEEEEGIGGGVQGRWRESIKARIDVKAVSQQGEVREHDQLGGDTRDEPSEDVF